MVTTINFSNIQLSDTEKGILLYILLFNRKQYNRSLFLLLIKGYPQYTQQFAHLHLSFSECLKLEKFFYIFDRAFLLALLDTKRTLFFSMPKTHISFSKLASNMLENPNDNSLKEKLIPIIANDIKTYNKGQTRIFFSHTRKNWANYTDSLPKDTKKENLGALFTYEKAILEIEYILKNSYYSKDPTINPQEIIDNYALMKINAIKNWNLLTIEELTALRKTYQKLRSFFLAGTCFKNKVPAYCYENYLDCIHLIYDYVEYYTDKKELDIAYSILDSKYSFYTYIATRYNNKSPYINIYTIPSEHQNIFNDLYQQSSEILLKLVYFADTYPYSSWESSVEYCIDIFSKYIKILYKDYNEPCYDNPFPLLIQNNFTPSLDEWLLYNALWNNLESVPQKDFIETFYFKAQYIDSKYGIIQLSLELFGIDVIFNKDIYSEIINIIASKKGKTSNLLIKYILKLLYTDKFYLAISFFNQNTSNDVSIDIHIPENVQCAFLHLILEKMKSYALFASGKEASNEWNDKMSDNLIYQFIYRNWYGLGLPDIFPNDEPRNHALINYFLQKHNLKLLRKINIPDYPWLQSALENLKKTPTAYQKYLEISARYTK